MASSGSESDAESFEVEEVIDKRGRGRNTEYLVLWKGFEKGDSSWEPERNLRHSIGVIDKYEESLKTPSTRQKRSTVQKRASAKTTTKTVRTVTNVTEERGAGDRSAHVKELVAQSLAADSQSDTSDRESSPQLGRRSLRQRYTVETMTTTPSVQRTITQTKRTSTVSTSSASPGALSGAVGTVTKGDRSIAVLILCLFIIAFSFVFTK